MDPGIQNADLVVFVSAFESLAGVDICSGFEEYGSNGGSDGGDDSSSSSSSSTSSSSSSSSNTPGGTGGDDMAVASTLAGATGCELDQYDRPVVGLVNFCLGLMDVTTTTASGGETRMVVEQDVVDLFVSVAMHEVRT